MRAFGASIALSATDLSNFLGCRHRTALDMAAALGLRTRPYFSDPLLDVLMKRGLEHERAYVASLAAAGHEIVDLSHLEKTTARLEPTARAMHERAAVIVQGALQHGRWFGLPDVMRRVEAPSKLGDWSYEIIDTKLALETRAGTILQLGLYSEMLAALQGARPDRFHVVTPDRESPVRTYRVDDYAAYVRLLRARMEATVDLGHEVVFETHRPEPVELCDVCPWITECRACWRREDHLSLVAGIARLHRRELEARDIRTLAALAQLPWPLEFRPGRGSAESWARVRDQARLQLASREKPPPPAYELRTVAEGAGLCRLPEPCPGDVFLDLEGDPFAAEGGREYLFGVVTLDESGAPHYREWWAFDERDERAAFKTVMDLIVETARLHPGMHVYHYAPYEPSAFKRLMGRYATRERELDALLRGERFVDLYAVVRQGMQAGIERYSIKNLEVFYGFERAVDLPDAGRCRALLEHGLELRCIETVPQDVRDAVAGYNRDDCLSTLRLRDWLETVRAELEASGTAVPRPDVQAGDPSEAVDERTRRIEALRVRLLDGVPEARDERTGEQQARWLMAYLLDWHRREDKAGWWEYFKLIRLPEEDLLDEPQAVAGLELVERVGHPLNRKGKPTRSVIDRYRYPDQEMEIDRGAELKLQTGQPFGNVVVADRLARTIDIVKGPSRADIHPAALFAHTYIDTRLLEETLCELGDAIASDRSWSAGPAFVNPVARELLLRHPPRIRSGTFDRARDEQVLDFAVRIGCDLDDSVLAIQGPPGSGKTFTGSHMIPELVARGKKVGVVGPSHKVIENLLQAVVKRATAIGTPIRVAQKAPEDDDPDATAGILTIAGNEEALAALQSGDAQVLGGTAWLWVRPELAGAVDVLFVDEAGQLSLANALAVSRAARCMVLLGDPQQLDQPQKGSHPDGVRASALEHILDGHQTIPVERGIFLDVTWRLAPSICAFTSEVFYEKRLESRAGLERQVLRRAGLEGSGLWVVEVSHDGNRNFSVEEVEVVRRLVAGLTEPSSHWVDADGDEHQVTSADVLVVAPYNAHVTRLAEALAGTGVRVGTVDRFQGQEAPIVIYSMATSRPQDAPRGMEFLYSLNRLNVATSRARCSAILVASERLFEPECRTPRQMQLANALCRFRELANDGGTMLRAMLSVRDPGAAAAVRR